MKLNTGQSAAENARALLPKMARKYFDAGRKFLGGKRPPEELHDFRMETKRLRYTMELFRPVYGPNLDRYLKALHELQSALGKVSDYQVIEGMVARDRDLKTYVQRGLKGKLKNLRQKWRAFDSDGELKRWRTYLAGGRSRPGTKRAKTSAAKKKATRARG